MFKTLAKIAGICSYVIQYGCVTHCAFEYIGDFVVCIGPSMEPTLHTNNVLVTDRLSPRLNKLQRGDIVIARSPTNPMQHVCKRIVGLPGDRILTKATFNLNPLSNTYTVYSTVISVNPSAAKLRQLVDVVSNSVDAFGMDNTVVEVVNSPPMLEQGEIPQVRTSVVTVPRGHVWIEGDNVHNSSDSRNYGPVPIGMVKSRAICRIWPLTEAKSLTSPNR
ncbi:mitochondrial inner membrane protease subunit 1 [Sabethes cyaneus]|uniref:mitochondrial inner membrane protease subunit 1 n=1 Tax=Sabethes cyaneus TaxID=53552 RepID=UPI00237E5BBE|nr:mitochondrial inner membrane protease subunit 1 [Sabethes cyaneus]